MMMQRRLMRAAVGGFVWARRGMCSTARTEKFTFSMVQMPVGSDKAANLAVAEAGVRRAAQDHGAQVVSLPECFNSPYATTSFPEYAEAIPTTAGSVNDAEHPSTAMLCRAAKDNGVWLFGGSFPERDGDAIYNTSVVVNTEGEVVARHRKMHLFDIDIPGKIRFMESDTLTAGNDVTVVETPYCKIGVAICYDMRFGLLSKLMADAGADMFIFPGAFNMTTGPLHWELLQRARAVDQQVWVAGVSPARNPEADYQAWGHSSLVSPWGEVVATTEHEDTIVTGVVDLAQVDAVRSGIPVRKQQRSDLYSVVSS